jgi:hypothetical protein
MLTERIDYIEQRKGTVELFGKKKPRLYPNIVIPIGNMRDCRSILREIKKKVEVFAFIEKVDEIKQTEYLETMRKEASVLCVKCETPMQRGKWVAPRQIMCNPCIEKSRKEDKKYWAAEQNDESDNSAP